MISRGTGIALGMILVLGHGQLGGAATVAAVRPPSIDGPVPPAADLASGPLRADRPCRTTAAVLDPGAPPASTTTADLTDAWIHGRGEGQVVAVIDTGVNPGPRLPRVRGAGDVVTGRDGTEDCDAHGTLVAGILAASEDEFGNTGVSPGVEIVSIRQSTSILRPGTPRTEPGRSEEHTRGEPVDGRISGVGTLSTLALAIRAAVDAGAGIINISETACVPAGTLLADDSLGGAIRYAAVDHDVVVVAAAGNLGDACATQNPARADPTDTDDDGWGGVETVASPAWYDDHVLTVAGVDRLGRPVDFSLRGPWVDVAAPAESLRSVGADGAGVSDLIVDGDGSRSPISGTSFATPFVAGTVALVRQAHPELSAREVIRRVEETAIPSPGGHDFATGHGVVDPVAAVTGIRRDGNPANSASTLGVPPQESDPPGTGRGGLIAACSLTLAAAVLLLAFLRDQRTTGTSTRCRPTV